jgi:hypothetical protein
MNGTIRRLLVVSALFASAAAAVSAGGWSIITVDDFPDYARAGTPLRLTFSVRQHGNRLVSGLAPTIRASSAGSADIIVHATPTTNPGEYAATLALPRPGDWTLLVDGGFNLDDRTRLHNSVALPTLQVIRWFVGGGPRPRGSEAWWTLDGHEGLPGMPPAA